LKAPPWLRVGSLFWADTLLFRRACREIKPDLVHAWGMELGAGLIGHRLGYPYLMTVQGLFGWYKENVTMGRYELFIERLERSYLKRAPLVTTESSFSVQYLRQRFPRLRVHQAEHAPNHAFFQVERAPQINPFHFIFVGSLNFRKGADLLFRALNQLAPQMPLKLTVICGPNPAYIETVRATVSPEFWQNIDFKHHILPHEVANEMRTPAVMLLPTRADVSPNAVKEAVVSGVPVLASQVGGIPDYVAHGKNGFLFPAGDLEQFVGVIKAACSHPLFSQGKVEPQTLSRMRDYLSPERMARNFLQAYETALGGRRP
jgi:glycosyltransferase involved in cell wall biosynthesis